MSHILLSAMKIGDKVEGIYYVQSIVEKIASNKKAYNDITIKDKSGSKVCKYWDTFGLTENISGFFAKLKLRIDNYQNAPSIVIEEFEACEPPANQEDYAEYYATQKIDLEYIKKVIDFIDKSKDKATECKELLKALTIYSDHNHLDKIKNCPYGTDMKLGALLNNTAKITSIAVKMADAYLIPLNEKCILLTACLTHGLGYLYYYSLENALDIKENSSGLLSGYRQLTLNYLNLTLSANIGKTPTIERLEHCILTDNFIVKPVTREAVIFNEIMRMHMNIAASLNFINADTTEGELTAFEPTMKRKFFK